MASVRSKLARKLKGALSKRFPPPAIIRLEEHNGIIGIVTSAEFERMDPMDRQSMIRRLLKEVLTTEERQRVQAIVAVTPDEATAYSAVPE